MLGNMNGWHLIMVLAVVVLLFGAAKLPALAKSVGQSARILRGEMKATGGDNELGSAPTISLESSSATDSSP